MDLYQWAVIILLVAILGVSLRGTAITIRKDRKMTEALDRLTASVASENTAIESMETLLSGLAQEIRDGVANGDDDALNALADSIDAKTAEIAAAVTANTNPQPGSGATVAPITVQTTSLPNGVVGQAYTAGIAITGGVSPYTVSGSLSGDSADGLSISGDHGNITGEPTTAGGVTVNYTITDSASPANTLDVTLTFTVAAVAPQ